MKYSYSFSYRIKDRPLPNALPEANLPQEGEEPLITLLQASEVLELPYWKAHHLVRRMTPILEPALKNNRILLFSREELIENVRKKLLPVRVESPLGLISLREIADRMNVLPSTVHRLIKHKTFKLVPTRLKISGKYRVFFKEEEIKSFIEIYTNKIDLKKFMTRNELATILKTSYYFISVIDSCLPWVLNPIKEGRRVYYARDHIEELILRHKLEKEGKSHDNSTH